MMPALKMPELKMPELNLSEMKMPELPGDFELPSFDFDDVVAAAKDGMYIAVGSSVLAFQRAQVARRDIQRRISEATPELTGAGFADAAADARRSRIDNLREQAGRLGEIPAVRAIDGQMLAAEERVDDVLDTVESKLPTPAQFMVSTMRETVKDSNAQVRSFIGLGA